MNTNGEVSNSQKIKIKCTACPGWCYSKSNLRTCVWCEGPVHKKCFQETLGCIRCCESIIPGYNVDTFDLYDKFDHLNLNASHLSFNPYDRSHIINAIGNSLDQSSDTNNEYWNEISEILTKCKYQEPKNVTNSAKDEFKVLSLNIRSLAKNITYLREEIHTFSKCDVLCFNETNCNINKLPNGTDDIMIEGFHEPVLQAPLRKSGRGGGLAIYINKSVCDFEKIERIDLALDPEDMSGEFQLVKIHNCKGLNKTKVIVNFYRSPSRDTNNFISLLDHVLNRLDRHSRKHVMFYGDANIDLIKYDTDSSSQNLIDTLAKYGFVQTVSKPTRVTDHSATLIDHVYTNNIENTLSSNVVTLDISDHLATLTTIKLRSILQKHTTRSNRTDTTKYRQTRTINDEREHSAIS